MIPFFDTETTGLPGDFLTMNFWFQKTPNDRAVRGVNYEKHGAAPAGIVHGAGIGKGYSI